MASRSREKDAKMAADLVRRGIFHGKRMNSTLAPPVPSLSEVGSAAYRRMMRKKILR